MDRFHTNNTLIYFHELASPCFPCVLLCPLCSLVSFVSPCVFCVHLCPFVFSVSPCIPCVPCVPLFSLCPLCPLVSFASPCVLCVLLCPLCPLECPVPLVSPMSPFPFKKLEIWRCCAKTLMSLIAFIWQHAGSFRTLSRSKDVIFYENKNSKHKVLLDLFRK